ncbi:MAG: putative dolichyl-phosphate-mannose--protein mannosyltransferase [Firmicutes bacterium ADurb.Bin182]|nr:MAG: putative dolichyl-phosphate-mannose--protein mannosyltransferase [Firmicutes bacterium ADurb.Bin182]
MKKTAALFIILALCLGAFNFASADSAELAANGDFELLTEEGRLPLGWYFDAWLAEDFETLVESEEQPGRGNTVHIVNYVENDSRLCLPIKCEPDSYYRISCDVKTKNAAGGVGANVSVEDSLATSKAVLGTNDWQRVELVGKTGSGQNELTVAVRLGGYGALSLGEAWFDNFSVTELTEKPQGSIADFTKAETPVSGTDEPGEMPYFGAILLSGFLTALIFILLIKNIGKVPKPVQSSDTMFKVVISLAVAFIVRFIFSFIFVGHSTDIRCFSGWASAMAQTGPSGFYTSGIFADYPPGYMYFLWLAGELASVFKIALNSNTFNFILKLPAIAADLASAYLVYKIALKKMPESSAFILMLVMAFNPVAVFISGGWGQIDSLLTLLLVGCMLLFLNGKTVLAGAVYGLAILIKPQALMAGPLLALAYVLAVKDKKTTIIRTVFAVVSAFAVIILLSLPFFKGQEPLWLLDKYFSTATSYPFASIEAFNFHSLFGGNWKPVEETLLFFSHGTWGTIFIAASLIYTGFLYIKSRKNNPYSLILTAAFLLTALFTLGQYMHERYLFPALSMILLSFIFYRDKRLFFALSIFSVTLLINTLSAFVIVDHAEARGIQYDFITFTVSLLEVLGFAYFAYVCTDILVRNNIRPAFQTEIENLSAASDEGTPSDDNHNARFEKRDFIYCWVLTAAYALIALLNLGSLQAPVTYWRSGIDKSDIRIVFDEPAAVDEIRLFGGIAEGTLRMIADDGTEVTYEQVNTDMFRWISIDGGFSAKEVVLSAVGGEIWINEIAFFDGSGRYIGGTAEGGPDGGKVMDEPDQVPALPSYLNGMYFDELYHARTAFEHLKGLKPYENSHPPLGKIFIMLGIAVFGMNPFGWRIVGTLFGISMVPIMYVFGKRLFKKSEYALLTAFLFAFDFMHFAQTRIATIDVYGVFFIILMYYFMYRYYCMNFFTDGLKKTLKPLGFAGLFFGLGAASKWIGFYAGAGLAVILFTSLFKRYSELRQGAGDVKTFRRYTVFTLLYCCLFFIVIPALVYLASYIPYVLSESHYDLKGIWDVQVFMYEYHSRLEATHVFQSSWWAWPFTIRPIWYFWNSFLPAEKASTIVSFGSPAVWWICTVGTVVLIYELLAEKIKKHKGIFVALVGIGANFLPWVLVTRCTFIYHFFATVPFIIICSVYVLMNFEEKIKRAAWIKWAWMGLVLLLFIVFYPALSGLEFPREYVQMLQWLPSWYFVAGS